MPSIESEDKLPSRYPDISITESRNTWWVAKVKTRQEKAFASELLKRNIEYYLPFYTRFLKRTDCNSYRKSVLPLFPSYVSFALKSEPWSLLQLNRISTIIPIKAQAKFKRELNQIYEVNERKINLIPVLSLDYTIGEKVRVVNGPLVGFVGEVVNLKGSNFLLLRVDGLGNACVSIDISNVVKCEENEL